MLKRWQFWAGLLISAVFLYFSLRGLKLDQVWETVRQARYAWLVPGVAVYFVAVWARSWRWHYMLRPLKKISTNSMFPIVTIGYMGNNIYPARAGEILRAVILKQREGVPVSASLATVIVERIFDGVVMLGFVFVNLPELARLTHELGPHRRHRHPHPRPAWLLRFSGRAARFLIGCHVPAPHRAPPRPPAACSSRSAFTRRSAISPCASFPGCSRCVPRSKP